METTSHSQDGAATLTTSDTLLWEALPHLQLNIAQTAALCGISVRQLGYWTKQGYVTASGRGARRLYGLDSLRRVLAVRNAMNNGASLRQALKAQPAAPATAPRAPVPEASPASPEADAARLIPLSPQEAAGLTADLLALFAANHDTRDDAHGLAVKVGRSPADIEGIAQALCVQGILRKTAARSRVVFQSARKDAL